MKNIKTNPEQEKYWKDRFALSESMGNKTENEILSSMKTIYKESLSNIQKEINNFYSKYAEQEGLSISEVNKRLNPQELKSAKEEISRYYHQIDELARKNGKVQTKLLIKYKDILHEQSAKAYMSRLEELKLAIQQEAIKLGVKETDIFNSNFNDLYSETYSRKSYEIDKYMGFSNGFSERNVEKAINERWLGANYSDRIWQNKDKLINGIETTFLQGIARGQNPRKIASELNKTMQTGFYNCERLCRTETIHILNEATYDSYKDHNIHRFQFVCGSDERTCSICGSLDDEVFDLKDKMEGANYPVLHPNCRCTTVPYFEPDEIDEMFEESTRVAKDEDGELYYVPESMTYDEWRKTFVEEKVTPTMITAPIGKIEEVKSKRFNLEFNDFMNKSKQDWNDVGEKAVISDLQKRSIARILNLSDISKVDECINNYIKGIDEYINNSKTLFIRHNNLSDILNNFDKFIKEPRLKTQFETGTSKGALNSALRNRWEENLTVHSKTYYKNNENSQNRPVYGEVIDRTHSKRSMASRYGDCEFILNKQQVLERTSFTMGNSSLKQMCFQKSFGRILRKDVYDNYDARLEILKASNFFDYDETTGKVNRKYGSSYIEFQSWGGLDFSKGDVSEVIIKESYKGTKNFDEFLKLMDKYKVKVTYKK